MPAFGGILDDADIIDYELSSWGGLSGPASRLGGVWFQLERI
jgi:hypothetical protein